MSSDSQERVVYINVDRQKMLCSECGVATWHYFNGFWWCHNYKSHKEKINKRGQ